MEIKELQINDWFAYNANNNSINPKWVTYQVKTIKHVEGVGTFYNEKCHHIWCQKLFNNEMPFFDNTTNINNKELELKANILIEIFYQSAPETMGTGRASHFGVEMAKHTVREIILAIENKQPIEYWTKIKQILNEY